MNILYNVVMDVKFGKIIPQTSANNPETCTPQNEGCNFFASQQNLPKSSSKPIQSSLRINDYDSNILENNAYQFIPDETFKLEHKIENLENALIKIKNEIEALYTIGGETQIIELLDRKNKIENELYELNKKYSQMSIGAKISGQISSAVSNTNISKKNPSLFKKAANFLKRNVLVKISKKFNYKETMKDALNNLTGINTSVDELINMQTPYGETVERYEKLTAYLNQANVIHAKIDKIARK